MLSEMLGLTSVHDMYGKEVTRLADKMQQKRDYLLYLVQANWKEGGFEVHPLGAERWNFGRVEYWMKNILITLHYSSIPTFQ